MNLDMQKEQFSRAYVQAVAACAGFAWSVPSVDDDSVDMTLHQTGGRGTVRSPQLALQLKCKAMGTPAEDEFSHWLKLKNYDDLRDTTVVVPRILVVVLRSGRPRGLAQPHGSGTDLPALRLLVEPSRTARECQRHRPDGTNEPTADIYCRSAASDDDPIGNGHLP